MKGGGEEEMAVFQSPDEYPPLDTIEAEYLLRMRPLPCLVPPLICSASPPVAPTTARIPCHLLRTRCSDCHDRHHVSRLPLSLVNGPPSAADAAAHVCGGGRSAAGERAEVIKDVERLIHATDMSRHADYLAALAALLDFGAPCLGEALPLAGIAAIGREPGEVGSAGPPPGGPVKRVELDAAPRRRVLGELVIKCADTSNVFKPLPAARAWAVRYVYRNPLAAVPQTHQQH